MLMYFVYMFAVIGVWLGLQSFLSGLRYASYVRKETSPVKESFTPRVSVIAPTRGIDDGLIENVSALLNQDYPGYEILFVFDSASDPAVALIEPVLNSATRSGAGQARIVVAGPATDSGQKVHNLRRALPETQPASEVFVFVDTDARPDSDWLRNLVAPLQDETIGASTGYRWFVPVNGGLASRLQSVWNASIASALGADSKKNFCWGGSTAIRRSQFERLDIQGKWRGTVSDDFTITRALHQAHLPIHFMPKCLVASVADCGLRELFEFTTRQLKITRVYAPHLWRAVLIGSILFTIIFFGGVCFIIARAVMGLSYFWLLVAWLMMLLLGMAKAFVRWRAITLVLKNYRRQLWRDLPSQLLLWPIASVLYLCNALAAAASRRIEWRGINYELKSAAEAVIIARKSF